MAIQLRNVAETIPDGAEVTVYLRNGMKFKGYENTSQDYIDHRILRLEDVPFGNDANRVVTISADEVVAVELRIES
jgi:hypothetical protein